MVSGAVRGRNDELKIGTASAGIGARGAHTGGSCTILQSVHSRRKPMTPSAKLISADEHLRNGADEHLRKRSN